MAITRRTLMERIDRFIRAIESRKREPDDWEGQCAKQALADIQDGHVEQAEAQMIPARTPPDLRASRYPPGVPPNRPSPTTAELRARFDRTKSQSPR